MNKYWQMLRQYRVLVDDGLVEDLVHKLCGTPFISRIGTDDNPVFYCPSCNTTSVPGVGFWYNMEQDINDNDLGM